MRWKLDRPKDRDIRIKRRFLWFPKIIHREIRWLEVASWSEVYIGDNVSKLYNEDGWYIREWVD